MKNHVIICGLGELGFHIVIIENDANDRYPEDIAREVAIVHGNPKSNNTLLRAGPISAGKNYCADIRRGCTTPKGSYHIQYKQGPGCFSSKYPVGKGGAPMPYCMFFHRGYALHGSYDVPGYHDSHGCVRLFVKDAKWLNQEFSQGSSVRVIVY